MPRLDITLITITVPGDTILLVSHTLSATLEGIEADFHVNIKPSRFWSYNSKIISCISTPCFLIQTGFGVPFEH